MTVKVLDPGQTETITPISGAVQMRRMRRLGITAGLSAAVALLLWIEREPLLRGAAEAWIVSDPVAPGGAGVLLGGGIDGRPFAAGEPYRKGVVQKVLGPKVGGGRAGALGAGNRHTEANRRVL